MSVNHPIIYRNITPKDYPALEYFMDTLFLSTGQFHRCSRLCLNRLYLYDSLSRHTYAKAAFLGSRIIGLITGRCTNIHSHHPGAVWRRIFYKSVLQLYPTGRAYYNVYQRFDQADRQLLNACPEHFEGELSFIAVDQGFRHQGIGMTLLGGFHKYMLRKNVRQIYLFTDSACCFGFYDRQRFDRLSVGYLPQKNAKDNFAFYLYKFSYF